MLLTAIGRRLGVLAVAMGVFGSAELSADEPYLWRQAVISGGGFVTGIYFHPANSSVVYMRTDMGGAYRLDAASDRWIPLQDDVGIEDYMSLHGICSIAFDPTDDNKVFMFTGMYTTSWGTNGAILRSDDRGETWQRTDLPFKGGANMTGRWCADRLGVDPHQPSILLVGTPQGQLYRSTDSAKTFHRIDSFPAIEDNTFGVVSVAFAGGAAGQPTQTIYAGVSRARGPTLYRSDDGGESWSAVPGGPGEDSGQFLYKIVKDRDDNLLLVYNNSADINMGNADPRQGWLYRYETNAHSWQTLHHTTGYGIGAVAADPQDAKVLMITSLARWSRNLDVWRSVDGGRTWNAITVQRTAEPPYATDGWPYPHWTIDIDIAPDNSDLVMISGVPGVYRTTEGTRDSQTWAFYNDGMEQTAVTDLVCLPTGEAQVYSAVLDISGFRHVDLDASPPDYAPELDGSTSLDFAQLDPDRMVRTTTKPPFGAYSDDAGLTWKSFKRADGAGRGDSIAISVDGAVIVWTSASSGANLHRSTDGGQSWIPVPGLPRGLRLASDRANPQVFYAYARREEHLYRSTDGGRSFERVTSDAPARGEKLLAHPAREGELWLGGAGGLHRSQDGGRSWMEVEAVNRARAIGFGKARTEGGYPALYLAGRVNSRCGIFRSDDAGASWVMISDAAHQFGMVQAITGDPRRWGRVYIGTNGRGVLYGDPRE